MGWVCENCSTNLDDDMVECFVCGAKRSTAAIRRDKREKFERKLAITGDKLFLLGTKITKIVFIVVALVLFMSFILAIIKGTLFTGVYPSALVIIERLKKISFAFVTTSIANAKNTIIQLYGRYTFESFSNIKNMSAFFLDNVIDNIGEAFHAYTAQTHTDHSKIVIKQAFGVLSNRIKASWLTFLTYWITISPDMILGQREFISSDKTNLLLDYFSRICNRAVDKIKEFINVIS